MGTQMSADDGRSVAAPEWQPVVVAFMPITAVYGIACFVAVFVRRKEFPVKGRAVSLVLALLFTGTVSTIFALLRLSAHIGAHCAIQYADNQVGVFPVHVALVGVFRRKFTGTVSAIFALLRLSGHMGAHCAIQYADNQVGVFLIHVALVRVFRLWFKLHISHEHLEVHRNRRKKTENLLAKKSSRTLIKKPKTSNASSGARKSESPKPTLSRGASDSRSKPEAADTTKTKTNVFFDKTMTVTLSVSEAASVSCSTSRSRNTTALSASGDDATVVISSLPSPSHTRRASDTNWSPRNSSNRPQQKLIHVSSLPEGRRVGNKLTDTEREAQRRRRASLSFQSYAAESTDDLAKDMALRFFRWKRLGKTRFLWTALGVLVALDVLIYGALYFARGVDCVQFAGVLGEFEWGTMFVIVNSGVCSLTIIWMAWDVRKFQEGFFLKTELYCWMVNTLLSFINLGVQSLFTLQTPSHAVSYFLLIHVIGVWSIYPVAKSYGASCHPFKPWTWCGCMSRIVGIVGGRSVVRDTDKTLMNILTMERYKSDREDFENHLASEFAIENIAFFDRAREFNEQAETMSDDQLALRAVAIFYDFINVGSPNQVNISASTRSTITNEFDTKFPNYKQFDPTSATIKKRKASTSHLFQLPGKTPNSNSNLTADTSASSISKNISRLDSVEDGRSGMAPNSSASVQAVQPQQPAPRTSAAGLAAPKPSSKSGRGQSRFGNGRFVDLNDRLSERIFEDAKQQVYALMSRDPFSRWKKTKRNSNSKSQAAIQFGSVSSL